VRAEWKCDLSYLGTYAQDRQAKLDEFLNAAAKCLREKKFIVAGAQYPATVSWPPNVQRATHVAPPEHPAFYSSSQFTLNLTRADMVEAGWSPSVRLFEASACGTAMVSDKWQGIEDFLMPGEELLLVESHEEMVTILRETTEEERVRLGMRARERVLAEHSATSRARQFERIVSPLSSRPARRRSEDTFLAVPA
jgi:spore maturation protein CgeB